MGATAECGEEREISTAIDVDIFQMPERILDEKGRRLK